MTSLISRALRRFRNAVLRLVLVIICLAIIGGVGLGFYAYYTRSPQAGKTRETIESARERAKDEERRWRERLAELKAQLQDTVDSYADGKEGAAAVRERIEAIKRRIGEAQKEFSPQYREKLNAWTRQADESLDALVKNSGAVGERLKGLWDDVTRSLSKARSEDGATLPAEAPPGPTPEK